MCFIRTEVIFFKSFTVLWFWSLMFAFNVRRARPKNATVKLKRRENDRCVVVKSALLCPTHPYAPHQLCRWHRHMCNEQFNERYIRREEGTEETRIEVSIDKILVGCADCDFHFVYFLRFFWASLEAWI